MDTKDELAARVRAAPLGLNGRPSFGAELRGAVLAYAKSRRAQGESATAVAQHLGVKLGTLYGWQEAARKTAPPATFVEVPARRLGQQSKAAEGFEVVCPSGHEVRVPARFDTAALRSLLAAVEGR